MVLLRSLCYGRWASSFFGGNSGGAEVLTLQMALQLALIKHFLKLDLNDEHSQTWIKIIWRIPWLCWLHLQLSVRKSMHSLGLITLNDFKATAWQSLANLTVQQNKPCTYASVTKQEGEHIWKKNMFSFSSVKWLQSQHMIVCISEYNTSPKFNIDPQFQ